MNKLPLVCALVSCVLVSPVGAMDNDNGYLEEVEQQEWQGMGAGAVAGGVVGGPAGIVIGAIGGALFGRSGALEEELGKTRQRVVQLQGQLSSGKQRVVALQRRLQNNETQLDGLEHALGKSREQYSDGLDAITSGFVLTIHFRTGDVELEKVYDEQLERLATALKGMPELDAHVDGYADTRGRNDLNMALSRMRAEVVKRKLQARGVESSRLVERAYGDSKAGYDAADSEGLAFDRKVLIHFCRRSET